METNHKILDTLEHTWPYITTVGAFLIGWIRLRRKQAKDREERIQNLEIIVTWLKENTATNNDLHKCREDVRAVDDNNLNLIYKELKEVRKEIRNDAESNASQHQDILNTIVLKGN